MKILFIGGTKFIGRQMVRDALEKGHQVSILQRGQTNAELFPEVKKYFGHRKDIAQILPTDSSFDMVIDTCGYHPEIVRASCVFLKDRSAFYVFISTASVYSDFSQAGVNENSKTLSATTMPPADVAITGENYGFLKALCEQEVFAAFGTEQSLILRPTIIVGPHDSTNRFDFWIQNILTQPKIDVPNDSSAHIQFVDVRALSLFALESIERKNSGIFNTIGPLAPTTLFDFLQKAKKVLNSNVQFNFVDLKTEQNFPMYTSAPGWEGFFKISGEKAYDKGFKDIPIEDTIKFVAAYLKN